MDGYEALPKLTEIKPDIKVVVISADSSRTRLKKKSLHLEQSFILLNQLIVKNSKKY